MSYSCRVSTLMSGSIRTFVRPYGPCTQVGIDPDTRVDTRPRPTSSFGFVYVCMFVYLYAYMYVCMYVCMYVYLCMYIYVGIFM